MVGYKPKNKKHLGNGFLSEAVSIKDPILMATLKNYKSRVARGYRTLTKDDIKGNISSGKYFVSPKIDGELWFLIIEDKEAWLGSPQGKVISGNIPLLKEAASFCTNAFSRTVLAGELFVTGKSGRPRVGDLANALGGGQKAKVDRLGFMALHA
jgi:hypothetical protein